VLGRRLPQLTPPDRTRESSFSYECRACGRCCHDKIIRVNPYEIARLAEQLGTSTTHVLASFTDTGGAALRTKDDGTCVFFDAARGCTVHGGRPLVCRLYPLGRYVDGEGRETYLVLAPEPGSEGIYGEAGVIEDYLRAQGVDPYVAAMGRYLAVMRKLLPVFMGLADATSVIEEANEAMRSAPEAGDANLLDVDAVVQRVCAEAGKPVPTALDDRIDLHLAFLESLARQGGG
jgi:uncharacterized protein